MTAKAPEPPDLGRQLSDGHDSGDGRGCDGLNGAVSVCRVIALGIAEDSGCQITKTIVRARPRGSRGLAKTDAIRR